MKTYTDQQLDATVTQQLVVTSSSSRKALIKLP